MAFTPRLVNDRVYLVPDTRGERFILAHLGNPEAYQRAVNELFRDTGVRVDPTVGAFVEYIVDQMGVQSIRGLMLFDQPRYHFYFQRRGWTNNGLPLPPIGPVPDPITPNEDPERPNG